MERLAAWRESAMAMWRSDAVQGDLMATWAEMPRSPGHAFYDRLQDLLREAGSMRSLKGCAGRITRRGWARRRFRRGGTSGCT